MQKSAPANKRYPDVAFCSLVYIARAGPYGRGWSFSMETVQLWEKRHPSGLLPHVPATLSRFQIPIKRARLTYTRLPVRSRVQIPPNKRSSQIPACQYGPGFHFQRGQMWSSQTVECMTVSLTSIMLCWQAPKWTGYCYKNTTERIPFHD